MPFPKVNPPVRHHRGQFWQNLRTSTEASVIVSQPRDVCDSSTKPRQQPASSRQALHPLRGATPVTSRYTRYEALHPIRRGAMLTDRVYLHSQQIPSRPHDHVTHRPMGTLPLPAANTATGFIPASATPVTGRYTRYVTLHPLRGATPDQKGCNADGSGAAPLRASTVAATKSRWTPGSTRDAFALKRPPLRTRLSLVSLATHCPLTSESRTRLSASRNVSFIRRACATSPCFHSALNR